MHHNWFKAFYQTFEIDIKLPLNCTGFLESIIYILVAIEQSDEMMNKKLKKGVKKGVK